MGDGAAISVIRDDAFFPAYRNAAFRLHAPTAEIPLFPCCSVILCGAYSKAAQGRCSDNDVLIRLRKERRALPRARAAMRPRVSDACPRRPLGLAHVARDPRIAYIFLATYVVPVLTIGLFRLIRGGLGQEQQDIRNAFQGNAK